MNLTNGQFSILMSLNRPKPAPMAGVADLLAMDRTTLTAALKPLVRRNLVLITPDPSDRRSRNLELTLEGKNVLASALPIWEQTHAEVEATLPAGQPESLRQGLRALA
ncbi:Organic hydroperoxide resistance transcriptional regulator [Granulicella sibirica]|uniref:Organic hydroperoxide resistance transcriptional regulator n=1 Tax=Granulicella sibirica TaxID=2479048 RepID=A0A4Q0SUG1_9BACT|nr:Organic hydroperoxide resistance transcriptional regulator [Granulicella sibirica]